MAVAVDEILNHNLEVAYRLLSACLYQPSPAWEESDIFTHLKTALLAVAPSVASGADDMKRALQAASETEVAVSHARLFVGPFSLGAPPYGSFYLEHEKRVMGGTTLAVQEYYRQNGLVLEKDFTELPDHMAVELEFLSFLLQRAIADAAAGRREAAAQWIDRRRDFLGKFVMGWYRQFCAAIREAADNPFYIAYADCLHAVISRDIELLGLA